VLYDINASYEQRGILLDVVKRVAAVTTVPFSVGGGLASVADCEAVWAMGARKVNVNSAAVKNPKLVSELTAKFGTAATVLSMDVLRVDKTEKIPSGFEIIIDGGRTHTGTDAIWWAKEAERLGAGEIVVNSIDADGTKEGFDIELTRLVAEAVDLPVVASGGGGLPSHVYDAFVDGKAASVLISSMLHFGDFSIKEVKDYLNGRRIVL